MKLLKTALLAILFGSLYTIFRKYQSAVDLKEQGKPFNQPLYLSFELVCKASSFLWGCPRSPCSGPS